MNWQPVEFAPEGVTLITRTGANLVFASRRDGKWTRDDGKEVHPDLWLEEEHAVNFWDSWPESAFTPWPKKPEEAP